MAPPDWLWIVFTLLAVAGQTFRNALQRGLTPRVGTIGATQVRFVFGLPFAILFFLAVAHWDMAPPPLHPAFFGWVVAGAVTQILATALLLAAMRHQGFVVVIAYSKTEPVQVALFGLAVLGDPLTVGVAVAVVAATAGVMTLSWPKAGAEPQSALPVVQGLASAACFAMSSVAFRGAIVLVGSPSFVTAATTTLVVGLVMQTLIMLAYTTWREPRTLGLLAAAWRPALLAGLLGAVASQFWFLAFAIESAAKVRTLGVIEIVFAQAVSLRLFREAMTWRGVVGLLLIAVAMVAVVNG